MNSEIMSVEKAAKTLGIDKQVIIESLAYGLIYNNRQDFRIARREDGSVYWGLAERRTDYADESIGFVCLDNNQADKALIAMDKAKADGYDLKSQVSAGVDAINSDIHEAEQEKERHLEIWVRQRVDHDALHVDGQGVSGVYQVMFSPGTPDDEAVTLALDEFHEHHAIKVLDDFDISVVDPQKDNAVLIESDKEVAASARSKCLGICKISDNPPLDDDEATKDFGQHNMSQDSEEESAGPSM